MVLSGQARSQGICDELRKLSVRQRRPHFDGMVVQEGQLHPSPRTRRRMTRRPFLPFDCRIMHWYGPDAHYWF